jgi:hypothetical protein
MCAHVQAEIDRAERCVEASRAIRELGNLLMDGCSERGTRFPPGWRFCSDSRCRLYDAFCASPMDLAEVVRVIRDEIEFLAAHHNDAEMEREDNEDDGDDFDDCSEEDDDDNSDDYDDDDDEDDDDEGDGPPPPNVRFRDDHPPSVLSHEGVTLVSVKAGVKVAFQMAIKICLKVGAGGLDPWRLIVDGNNLHGEQAREEYQEGEGEEEMGEEEEGEEEVEGEEDEEVEEDESEEDDDQ